MKKKKIEENLLSKIIAIQDPPYVKSKGRPKNYKRILGLYEKLKLEEKSRVKPFISLINVPIRL